VVVTGIGPILPGCRDSGTFWDHLRNGHSQLELELDPNDPTASCAVGRVGDLDPQRDLEDIPERFTQLYHRELQLYLASVFSARREADIDLSTLDRERVGLYDGAARHMFAFWYERLSERGDNGPAGYTRRDLMTGLPGQTVGIAASLLQIRGPALCFSGTCSAGAMAIGQAFRDIRAGDIDVGLATGHESCLVPPVFGMYHDAHLISHSDDAKRAVRAFVGHSGNAFAEGAVTLVLESLEHAESRGAEILAELCGYKYGNNGYHPTSVDVSGVRPAEIIESLLVATETARDEVDFVVGHGNGVQLSDVSEQNYMRLVFGQRAREIPLLSTKPIFGHTLGASSAVNAAASVFNLHHGFVFPTINIDESRQKRAVFHQANHGAYRDCRVGLSMAYGMGGHNTVLLFRRFERQSDPDLL